MTETAIDPLTAGPAFESFASIERIQQNITITEKIHGTNAQIRIEGLSVLAGSRTRWITVEDDNYGFAAWVAKNAAELIAVLGEGRHYGEWYGSGINAGYGMRERRFALFNPVRWTPVRDAGALPPGVDVVPVLYSGPWTDTIITETMDRLKTGGSVLVPGYAKPEGVVVWFDRTRVMMKRTFEAEDSAWHYKADRPPQVDRSEAEALCAPFWQPIRLEKLLSRDETYGRDYPSSLPALVSAYVHDVQSETDGVDEATWKLVKKGAFKAVKAMMAERGYSA